MDPYKTHVYDIYLSMYSWGEEQCPPIGQYCGGVQCCPLIGQQLYYRRAWQSQPGKSDTLNCTCDVCTNNRNIVLHKIKLNKSP